MHAVVDALDLDRPKWVAAAERLAAATGLSRTDAEDIVQQALLKIDGATKRDPDLEQRMLRCAAVMHDYYYKCLLNATFDMARGKRDYVLISEEAFDPVDHRVAFTAEEIAHAKELRGRIEGELNDHAKTALRLLIEGASSADVAKAGLSPQEHMLAMKAICGAAMRVCGGDNAGIAEFVEAVHALCQATATGLLPSTSRLPDCVASALQACMAYRERHGYIAYDNRLKRLDDDARFVVNCIEAETPFEAIVDEFARRIFSIPGRSQPTHEHRRVASVAVIKQIRRISRTVDS